MLHVPPLVSIVMPAYKATYIEQALDSLLAQTYPTLELVICDDSADARISEVLDSKRAQAGFPIRHFRNEARLGELGSKVRGISLAQGKYIKFLHDDDVLMPGCIEELVAAMESDPSVAMASSRRLRIDEAGEPLPDILATCFPFAEDVLIDGRELVSFLADHTINFIGEPSCVLCRREDLLDFGEELMSLNGKVIHWVGDLALYAKVLQRGHLAFLSTALTQFRVSEDQFSQAGRDRPGIGEQGHIDFRQAVRDLGWYRTGGNNRRVGVAPISQSKARVFKSIDILAALMQAGGLTGNVSPAIWLGSRQPNKVQSTLIAQRLQAHGGGPRIGILVADPTEDAAALDRTRNSLAATNLYRNADILPLDQARIADEGLVATLNGAIAQLDAQWILLVQAGAEFTASGLLMLALHLIVAPEDCHAVYADEVASLGNAQLGLLLRPDFNLDMLLSAPSSLSGHWLFRRQTLQSEGGFDQAFPRSFQLAYQLRLVERHGLGSIHHVAEPLLIAPPAPLQDQQEERDVILRHLHTRGYDAARIDSMLPGCHAIDYGHPQQPSISVMVVVEGRLPQVQRCVESLLATTRYPFYELLLLDHGNAAPELLSWLESIEKLGLKQIRVLRFPAEASRATVCNAGSQQAQGDFLLWLGDGAAIIKPDWLHQLINHGLRPEVGTVGAKLLQSSGAVRDAGLLLGLGGPAGHAFEGSAFDESGYMQRLQIDQDYSALGGECLLLRRELFLEAGGFDEDPALQPWASVDLCLKLRQAGYLNVWTPRAQLVMDSRAEPAPQPRQLDQMYARWLPLLARDPAYNPGFSLEHGHDFKLADPHLSWRPLQSWQPLPTVLALPADLQGCGHYRVIQPLRALREAALVEGVPFVGQMQLCDIERYDPDVILLQRQVGEERLEAMRRMQAFTRAFKVYELDDYLPNLPLKNAHRAQMPKDILKTIRRGLGYVDRFVVSTPALADAFNGLHADIRVIENRLPAHWWADLNHQRGQRTGKPRIGWAGGASHSGDLELIADVVRELADEVDWVFMGMCPPHLRRYLHEFHAGVPIELYPAALAALDLDIALAPVEQNLFNECKSNLRLLEYGACGYPVIASDVRCYTGTLPVTLVKNRFRDWTAAIRTHLADPAGRAAAGDALREAVQRDWMLTGRNLDAWREAWLPD